MLFHTSPKKIEKVDSFGRFGSFLFFASSPYSVTGSDSAVVYEIDDEDLRFIEPRSLFFHEDAAKLDGIVGELMERLGCDEGTATDVLSERQSVYDIDTEVDSHDLAELSWDVQRMTAECAKLLGFDGVEVEDEQGTAWMIDMSGREDALVEVSP